MTTHTHTYVIPSERVVIAAPMSLAGSAARIWRMTNTSAFLIPVALTLTAVAWIIVLAWYVLFGLLLVPYRIIRRGQRKRKREALMHREQLAALRAVQLPE